MKRRRWFLWLSLFCPLWGLAQVEETPYLSWTDFVEEYFSEISEDEENTAAQSELYESFESLYLSPININTASREALLSIPLLNEEQTDSILSYRHRKHRFLSLGELMLVRNLSHSTRRYLSLFLYCGEQPKQEIPIAQRLYKGKHSLESRLDIPFYQREGYKEKSKQELAAHPNSIYLGNALHHQVRYRYKWKQDVAYGFTVEKDPGEPFGKYNSYPYDYNTFYFHYRHSPQWEFFAGDFGVRAGHGLLFGKTFFTSRIAAVEQGVRSRFAIKSHTSADESNFLRGAAAIHRRGCWEYALFASYRQLDARVKDGKVTSLPTNGYHRTYSEYALRRQLGNYVVGGRISFNKPTWHIGLNGFYSHYDKEIAPPVYAYNRFYLRGKNAAGLSADYQYRTAKWNISGEVAFDKRFHIASSHAFSYHFDNRSKLLIHQRSHAHRFVSPFANSLQQGSKVANELGLTIGGEISPSRRLKALSYIDLFRFPAPTYTADKAANGLEFHAQGEYALNKKFSFHVRYKLKARQYNVSGYDNLLEARLTHRLRFQLGIDQAAYNVRVAADFTAACSQTKAPSLGWMLSGRSSIKLPKHWQIGCFGGLFFTDDYSSAIYAYEPQLRHAFSFPRFYHHGCRLLGQVGWQSCKHVEVALRYGWLYYFNQHTIGSGLQEIDAPTTNDLSIYLRFSL